MQINREQVDLILNEMAEDDRPLRPKTFFTPAKMRGEDPREAKDPDFR